MRLKKRPKQLPRPASLTALGVVILVALLAGSCSSDNGSSPANEAETALDSESSPADEPSSDSGTALESESPAASPEPEPTRVLPTPRPAATPAGQSINHFAPEPNDPIAVYGVAEGERLPMYALPGLQHLVVAEIPNTAEDVFGLGEAFQTEDGLIWWLMRWDRFQGWVLPGVAYRGLDTDITNQVIDGSVAGPPTAASMTDLALLVAEQFLTAEPSAEAVLVASTGDDIIGHTTVDRTAIVDVVGLGDDSVAGFRLLVSGDASAGQATQIELTSVHQISLCWRGVSPEGLCT